MCLYYHLHLLPRWLCVPHVVIKTQPPQQTQDGVRANLPPPLLYVTKHALEVELLLRNIRGPAALLGSSKMKQTKTCTLCNTAIHPSMSTT